MERFANLLNMAVVPQTKGQVVLYIVDMIGLSMTAAWITGTKETLSVYILILTAISLTVTVGVKIYNLFNRNDKNKKV